MPPADCDCEMTAFLELELDVDPNAAPELEPASQLGPATLAELLEKGESPLENDEKVGCVRAGVAALEPPLLGGVPLGDGEERAAAPKPELGFEAKEEKEG